MHKTTILMFSKLVCSYEFVKVVFILNEKESGNVDDAKSNTVYGYEPVGVILSAPIQLLSTISVVN